MEASKKKEIIDDLVAFSKAEDFYARIGKAWKRGYLLYGPPGTGKSTMVAAMANLLKYDVYDLELTAVKDNTELRMLLMQMSSKSVLVIEDIDCSLDLTGQRIKKADAEEKKKRKKKADENKTEEEEAKTSNVTLSGLLNFIDGLWTASKGERVIVFTTNFKEKLDPALVRRGRMDKHIELSYCRLEAFKVLASNYWGVESHSHPSFEAVGRMLEETDMTPADVAECLMPKTEARGVEECISGLIEELEARKEAAKVKAEEDAMKEEEEKKGKIEEKDEKKNDRTKKEQAEEKKRKTEKEEEKKSDGTKKEEAEEKKRKIEEEEEKKSDRRKKEATVSSIENIIKLSSQIKRLR